MAYKKGTKLPGETASKLGHLNVVKSEWVRSLIEDFEYPSNRETDPSAPSGNLDLVLFF